MGFLTIVLPVFLVAGFGFALGRRFQPDLPSIAKVTLYGLTPAIVFVSLAKTKVATAELGWIGLFAALFTAAIWAAAALVARLLGLPRELSGGFQLCATMMNAGNFGLPIALYAFGQAGFERAVAFMVVQAIAVFSLGVYLVARSRLHVGNAIAQSIRMPALWGAVLGVLLQALDVAIPLPLLRPLELIAQAAVPMVLLLLGMQLAQIDWPRPSPGSPGSPRSPGATEPFTWSGPFAWSVILRLAASPVIAWALVQCFPVEPLTRQVLILQSSMPTAANAILLAQEYGAAPSLVAAAVFASTLGSALSLSLLLHWLGV